LNSNQILRHVISSDSPSGGVCLAFATTTNGETGILQAVGKFLFLGIFWFCGAGFCENLSHSGRARELRGLTAAKITFLHHRSGGRGGPSARA
jgi:hypothetical protein